MASEVYQEVEAALLNSSGPPKQEVQNALCAIVKFSKLEFDVKDRDLSDMLEEQLRQYKANEDQEA